MYITGRRWGRPSRLEIQHGDTVPVDLGLKRPDHGDSARTYGGRRGLRAGGRLAPLSGRGGRDYSRAVHPLAPAALAALAALALVVPAGASAKPAVCHRAVLEASLVESGELTAQRIADGERVNLVRCGDVTDDGIKDALFAVASGGTAGNTRFGVIEGREDGSAGGL